MERDEIMERLQGILKDILGKDEITISEDTCPIDIEGWDSLANINIVAAIQDEFSIIFDIEEILEMKSIKGFVDGILEKL